MIVSSRVTDKWLTLVILAYDRPAILDRTVRSLVARMPLDVKILVSINEKPVAVEAVVTTANKLAADLGIEVVRTGGQLSMTEHFNWAWKRVRTPYFMLLGDDDGVSSQFVEISKQIIDERGPAVVQCHQAYVILESLGEFFPEGRVLLPIGNSGTVTKVSALEILRRDCLARAPMSNMLKVIPTDLIRDIDGRCGRWCWGLSPDITGGKLMLAELSEKQGVDYWSVDSPLTVCGQSRHSNAASTIVGRGKGRIKEFTKEHGKQACYPDWIQHKVSVGLTTDLIKIQELIEHFYPDALRPIDKPDPNCFMPDSLAESMPLQAPCSQEGAPLRWWERRPAVLLMISESIGRNGRSRTLGWLGPAVAIWIRRVVDMSSRSIRNYVKSLVPESCKSAVSRTLHPLSRRQVVWEPYRGTGNWDSEDWSSLYLPDASDVASMPWLGGRGEHSGRVT